MNYIVYTAKFGGNGTKHQYTKKIGAEVTQIEFKEYFDMMIKSTGDRYNEYYAYSYSTFSITEKQYKEYTV